MALKYRMLQLYHKSLKLSLVLTVWGGCLLSNPAAANTALLRSLRAETNNSSPILQAQILSPPVAPLPPTSPIPSSPLPPPPTTIIYGEELEAFGRENTFEERGFSNLRYAVYINGNSAWLLKIIREIESKAVLRKYQNRTVIQVGSFSDRFFAEDLANFFQFQGIKAQIVKLNSGDKFGEAVATENADLFPPVVQAIDYGLGVTNAYYVLIPGEARNLSNIRQQVVLLGMPQRNTFLTEVPANVAVGPFNSEGGARQWQRYLQDFGFPNAELYFGR
ncbi:MAG: hypothetical protein SXA11_18295 [Cyanobacteriota bacterium]|nr:hypothetical protein [Cyanobacteriota bacterium]